MPTYFSVSVRASARVSRVVTVPSAANRLHTTPTHSNCCVPQGLVARLHLDRGQLCFLQVQPRALGARVPDVFIATSIKAGPSFRPTSSVRTAAVPNLLSRVNVSSGTACSTVLSARRSTRLSPSDELALRQVTSLGDPAPLRGLRAERDAPLKKACARWDGGGSHRLAGPGREQFSPPDRLCEALGPSNTPQQRHQCGWLDAIPSFAGAVVSDVGPLRPGVQVKLYWSKAWVLPSHLAPKSALYCTGDYTWHHPLKTGDVTCT